MSGATDIGLSGRAAPDRFLKGPLIAAVLLWTLIEGQLVSSPNPLGGLLPSPGMILTIILMGIAVISSAVALPVFVVWLKWRKFVSVLLAALVFTGAVFITPVLTYDLREWIARLHVNRLIRIRKLNGQVIGRIDGMVTSTDDVWTKLVYDESDADKPLPGHATRTWLDYSWLVSGCTVVALPKGGHYYIERTNCAKL